MLLTFCDSCISKEAPHLFPETGRVRYPTLYIPKAPYLICNLGPSVTHGSLFLCGLMQAHLLLDSRCVCVLHRCRVSCVCVSLMDAECPVVAFSPTGLGMVLTRISLYGITVCVCVLLLDSRVCVCPSWMQSVLCVCPLWMHSVLCVCVCVCVLHRCRVSCGDLFPCCWRWLGSGLNQSLPSNW